MPRIDNHSLNIKFALSLYIYIPDHQYDCLPQLDAAVPPYNILKNNCNG